jgi:organic hydroperoxide reductase OsmC/OhrA
MRSDPHAIHADEDLIAVRVEARGLLGMQKEALVYHAPTSSTWRMVSDEGPYLNGTDLAPFPLAFFSAGMAFSMLDEVEGYAASAEVILNSVTLEQDNYYTMQGSAIRGDMIGGSLPVELILNVEAETTEAGIAEIVRRAAMGSPAQSYMSGVLQNTFSLESNGHVLQLADIAACPSSTPPDPAPHFDRAGPVDSGGYLPDIITKLATAEVKQGVAGGAGSSLKSEQKRTLHVHSQARILQNGLLESNVQLLKPIGSTFRFLSDKSGKIAPPALSYLAAGVGFCFMTQLGRYAQIVKQDLRTYRIVQDNVFQPAHSDASAVAFPVETHVFITLDDSDDAAQKLLWMGERTCFLHAAMRSQNQSEMKVFLNGEVVRSFSQGVRIGT